MIGGAASALSGAGVGLTIGVVASPSGMWLNRILSAMLGACAGGVAGGVVGSRLGEVVDDHILHNRRCLACGYTFSTDVSQGPSTV